MTAKKIKTEQELLYGNADPIRMNKILRMLKSAPASCQEIVEEFRWRRHGVTVCLKKLQELGKIQRTYTSGARWKRFEAISGAEYIKIEKTAQKPDRKECGQVATERRKFTSARQIGMQRHWMDIALFGPAKAVAM